MTLPTLNKNNPKIVKKELVTSNFLLSVMLSLLLSTLIYNIGIFISV
jgi:hypothetical protein